MPIPIPPNLPMNPLVDFRRNDLIAPPAAPAVVESLNAIDPRVALNMPMPVGGSSAGGSLLDALQNAASRGQQALSQTEPDTEQAVLLEISSMTSDQAEAAGNPSQSRIDSLLSQSLSRMDNLGGAALGQLLSDILEVDVPELGNAENTSSKSPVQNVIVNWPDSKNLATGSTVANSPDPKAAMHVLYQNLQTSGIFAADQLKKLLFPASNMDDEQAKDIADIPAAAEKLISQLSANAPVVQDSVKLLLRGDLLWQGQLMPNVQGRLYREDAWQPNPMDSMEMQKGSKITLEVILPNLGPFKVVGTQFGESVHVAIESAPEAQATLANSFPQLLEQMRAQVDPDAIVSLKGEIDSHG